MVLYILIIAYFGVTMYAANQVQIQLWEPRILRFFLYGAVITLGLLALLPLQAAFLTHSDLPDAAAFAPVDYTTALVATAFAALNGLISLATLNSPVMRNWIARVIGTRGRFNPDSNVHVTAVVLACLLVTGVTTLFVISGGIEGLAESLETSGVNPYETLLTLMLQVIAGVLGVGYAIRRNAHDTLTRLGLVMPTRKDVVMGVGVGIALFLVTRVLLALIMVMMSPEQFQDQTQAAEQLTLALNSLPIALLVSLSAAIGEEIFVRGALQPIFGIWLSSLFFTLLHTQYFITPSLLLIFVISVIFGILRQRYNTTTAMIAHFTYNFVPLLILVSLGSTVTS